MASGPEIRIRLGMFWTLIMLPLYEMHTKYRYLLKCRLALGVCGKAASSLLAIAISIPYHDEY